MEKHYTAKNGLDVYTYELPNTHGFYLSLFVKAGSMYEAESDSGITHFLEHIAIRNVNRIMGGRLYALLDEYGIEFNASTYSEMVQFYLSGSPRALPVAARILAAVLAPINLPAEDFEAERARIRAEIREGEERTSLSQFTLDAVYDGGPLSRPITGTGRSVSRITRRKIEGYRRAVFTRENSFVYLTGAFTEADLDTLLHEMAAYPLYEGEIRDNTAPVSNYFGKRPLVARLKNSDFCKVRFTFDLDMSKMTLPETDLCHAVLVGGYSSSLFVEMSERRGLFYDVDSQCDRYKNIGILAFTFELREAHLYEALELVVELLGRLKTDLLPRERCMYSTYVDNSPMLLDSPRELNFTMAYDNHVMDMGYPDLDARTRAYAAVTPERIRDVFATILTRDNLTFTMKGRKKTVDLHRVEQILAGL